MKLSQLIEIIGNANIIVTNEEQDDLFFQGAASEVDSSAWDEYEVIKFEKLEDIHEVFETPFFYEITLNA